MKLSITDQLKGAGKPKQFSSEKELSHFVAPSLSLSKMA